MVRVDIIYTIKTAQAQNGLRHNDYLRYRRFCTSKLAKLRKSTKFHYGSGQFQSRVFTAELCQDARYLYMILYNAERAWGHAMQLRQYISYSPGRKARRHLLTRLRKAAKWAELLEELLTEVGDVKSTLEAQAYKALMQGNLELEEAQWGPAQDSYVSAQVVLQKLHGVADAIEAVAINEKLSHIHPMIRFCQHQLGGAVDTEELLHLKFSSGPEAELLNAQVEGLLAEKRKERVQNVSEISIKGKIYSITNEKARQALQKAEEIFIAMDRAVNKLNLYTEAFGHYDEAVKWIRKEREDAESMGDLSESNIWAQLEEAVQELKTSKLVDRNFELVKLAEEKFENESDAALQGEKTRGKPQDVIKIYDGLLTHLKTVKDHDTEMKVRGKRAYWVALLHLYNGKPFQSYAVLQRCAEFGNYSDEVNFLMLKLQGHLAVKAQEARVGFTGGEECDSLWAVGGKPVFYDLSLEYIEYPKVDHRVQAKGVFSALKGWWGRGN